MTPNMEEKNQMRPSLSICSHILALVVVEKPQSLHLQPAASLYIFLSISEFTSTNTRRKKQLRNQLNLYCCDNECCEYEMRF